MIPKYRAWDKKLKKMFEVSFIDFDTKLIGLNIDLEIIIFDFEDVIRMQSTGLKDKNGKEIFEGDILEVTDKHSWLEVVSYSQEKAMFVTEEINREFKVPESPLYDLSDSTFLKFKVIGNIYENPELLEVE